MDYKELNIHIPSDMFTPAKSMHFSGLYELCELNSNFDKYIFKTPVKYEVEVTNTGEAFLVSGYVSGKANTSCARCLEDTVVEFEGNIDGYYLIDPSKENDENYDEDFDVLPQNHEIDLASLIVSSLLIAAPFQPLCMDDCKGICPKCGANLNVEICKCSNEDQKTNSKNNFNPNSPFAALKDFKVD